MLPSIPPLKSSVCSQLSSLHTATPHSLAQRHKTDMRFRLHSLAYFAVLCAFSVLAADSVPADWQLERARAEAGREPDTRLSLGGLYAGSSSAAHSGTSAGSSSFHPLQRSNVIPDGTAPLFAQLPDLHLTRASLEGVRRAHFEAGKRRAEEVRNDLNDHFHANPIPLPDAITRGKYPAYVTTVRKRTQDAFVL